MVEFRRVIADGEARNYYLNLTDMNRTIYGRHFPAPLTRLAIIDGDGRVTFAKKHGNNQIWNSLENWFRDNNVQSGAIVLVRYDANESQDDLHVVHLILQPQTLLETAQVVEDISSTSKEFASEIPLTLEKQLEDFLSVNLHLLEASLELYVDEDGNTGRQYPTDVGTIDLLCRRKDRGYLIIELKRSKSSDVVVGQISRYMGWIKEYIAQGQAVSGLILTHDRDDRLKYAVLAHDNIALKYFKIRLQLVEENEL
jgi:RecB family endonuclease NucS